METDTLTTGRAAERPTQNHACASITAIVPARNEEVVIADCVRSLARQPEIGEIVVVNDHSEDKTAEVVRGLCAQVPRLKLLDVGDAPENWVGKSSAVWTGAREAESDWLLFVDADAEVLPGAAERALQIAEKTGAVLVSFSPEQRTETWYEKALIPFVYWRLSKHFSFAAVNDPNESAAAANGQFLMIRRDVYEGVGGHASVATDVLEDVALAIRVKNAGYKIWFGAGDGLVRVRMYRSFDAMMQGWTKNLYRLIGGSPASVYRELLAVVPWVAVILLLLGLRFPFALLMGIGLLIARHADYGFALAHNRSRVSLILYYVPAVALYTSVVLRSYRAHIAGRAAWKGREVALPRS